MLKLRSPNGEVASIAGPWEHKDECFFAQADSKDFGSPVLIRRRYCRDAISPYITCVLGHAGDFSSVFIELVDKDGDRFGGLMPIASLCESEHPRAADDYFHLLASVALSALVSDESNQAVVCQAKTDVTYEISDFFPPNSWILVVNKSMMYPGGLMAILPWLAAFGFAYLVNDYPMDGLLSGFELEERRRVKIRPLNVDLIGAPFMKELYCRMLPSEASPLAQFVMIYQVIELLIHQLFIDRLATFKAAVAAFGGTASDLRQIASQLNDVASERDRIRECIDQHGIKTKDHQGLVNSCADLLKSCNLNPSEHLAFLIYDVRNLIFHGLRALPPTSMDLLVKVNRGLCALMPRLMVQR